LPKTYQSVLGFPYWSCDKTH